MEEHGTSPGPAAYRVGKVAQQKHGQPAELGTGNQEFNLPPPSPFEPQDSHGEKQKAATAAAGVTAATTTASVQPETARVSVWPKLAAWRK
jgi:hypothetical protein